MNLIDHHRIIQITGRSGPKPLPEGAWFRSGREALVALLRSWKRPVPEGRIVLLPAFCPEGLYAPFRSEGWDIVFYDLTVEGNPDFSHLQRLALRTQPQVAVLIHLFGVRRDIVTFRKVLGDSVFILEDFAQTWPAEHLAHNPQGGDARLFSLPKLAGLPDGGGLELVAGGRPTVEKPGSAWGYTGLRFGALIAATLARKTGVKFFRWLSIALNGRAYRILRSGPGTARRMSGVSRFLLRRLDQKRLIDRHLKQAEIYRTGIKNQTVTAMDNGGDWPMIGFPVLVDNRPHFLEWLAVKGVVPLVFSAAWSFIPEGEDHLFPGATALSGRHVLLPVCVKLTDDDIWEVVRAVNDYPG